MDADQPSMTTAELRRRFEQLSANESSKMQARSSSKVSKETANITQRDGLEARGQAETSPFGVKTGKSNQSSSLGATNAKPSGVALKQSTGKAETSQKDDRPVSKPKSVSSSPETSIDSRKMQSLDSRKAPPPIPYNTKPKYLDVANLNDRDQPIRRHTFDVASPNVSADSSLKDIPAPPQRLDMKKSPIRQLSSENSLLPPRTTRHRSHTATASKDSHRGSSPTPFDYLASQDSVHRPPPTRLVPPTTSQTNTSSEVSAASSEDDGECEDSEHAHQQNVADIPDATFASRRPPDYEPPIHLESKVHLTCVATFAAFAVLATAHHVHIYNWRTRSLHASVELSSETHKVTAASYVCDEGGNDGGNFVWIGTKEGAVFEIDIKAAKVVGENLKAHRSAVQHIFRRKSSMITVDQSMTVQCWGPSGGHSRPSLSEGPSHNQRLDEKTGTIRLINNVVWVFAPTEATKLTPARTDQTPDIHIHFLKSNGSLGQSQAVEVGHLKDKLKGVGPVTGGSEMPKQPDLVYLSHETGHITVWSIASTQVVCVDVRRVSTSRITSIQGVGSFLWTGYRSGVIQIHDITEDPWRVVKVWQAHAMCVNHIHVLPAALWTAQQLPVLSFSIEGEIRAYDGFMAAGNCSHMMTLRQAEWCSYREVKIQICTWNCDSSKPSDLLGLKANSAFPISAMDAAQSPDILVFTFQELIDLSSRSTTAKSFFLGRKKADGKLQEAVSHRYQLWRDKLASAVAIAFQGKEEYTCVISEILVGLFTCIFVKSSVRSQDAATALIKTGFAGLFGNKGAILSRIRIDDSTFCFINCHLAAGQRASQQRGRDLRDIFEIKRTLPVVENSHYDAYIKGGDGTHVFDHSTVFLSGDLNYRIDTPRARVLELVQSNHLKPLIDQDQLTKSMRAVCNVGRVFPLRPFKEAPITFAPTYKYDRGTNDYDTSEKSRAPAWCDRILWCTQDDHLVTVNNYKRHEVDVSDHRPVSASFKVRVKKADREKHGEIYAKVLQEWEEMAKGLIADAQEYYRRTF